jgi:hypothetical protein
MTIGNLTSQDSGIDGRICDIIIINSVITIVFVEILELNY